MTEKQKSKDRLSQLKANPNNPRKEWETVDRKADFAKSINEFGDLSGIIFNVESGQLVGGHKRIAELKDDKKSRVVITDRLKNADDTGTIAYGYVYTGDGLRFAYREVSWNIAKESAANLAANKWSAEWDMAKVRDLLKEASGEIDLAVTGFDLREVAPWLLPDRIRTTGVSVSGEVDVDAMVMQCCCPECNFEFNPK